MGYTDKGTLLGASDLREQDLELPSIGATVRVRGLAAAFSNQAQSEALELVTDARGRQTATVNTDTLECLQVLHGLVEPKLASANATFPAGGAETPGAVVDAGSANGDAGPDLPVRVGTGAEDAGE